MQTIPVLTVGLNGNARVYSSIRSAARVLSGDGTDRSRTAIANRIAPGGGYVGGVWVTDGSSFVLPQG